MNVASVSKLRLLQDTKTAWNWSSLAGIWGFTAICRCSDV